jgi:hypothetical protein
MKFMAFIGANPIILMYDKKQIFNTINLITNVLSEKNTIKKTNYIIIVLLQKRINKVSCSANYQNKISLLDKKVFDFNFFLFSKKIKLKFEII